MNRLGGWFTRAEAGTEHPGSLSGPPGRPPSRRRARDDAMQTPGKDPWGDPQPGLEKRPALDPWGDPVRGASLCTRLVLADLPRPGPPTPPAAPRTHPLAPAPWPGSPGSGSRPVRSPRVTARRGPGRALGASADRLSPPAARGSSRLSATPQKAPSPAGAGDGAFCVEQGAALTGQHSVRSRSGDRRGRDSAGPPEGSGPSSPGVGPRTGTRRGGRTRGRPEPARSQRSSTGT